MWVLFEAGVAFICAVLQELRQVSEQELRAVEEDLQKEAAEDADLKAKYGPRWSRPASVALNSQITEKIAGQYLS